MKAYFLHQHSHKPDLCLDVETVGFLRVNQSALLCLSLKGPTGETVVGRKETSLGFVSSHQCCVLKCNFWLSSLDKSVVLM